MKNLGFTLTALLSSIAILSSGCLFVTEIAPGPAGRPGDAYFGVDYDYAMPYSFWDNNRSIPNNPELGSFYPTNTGVFDFEYFINPTEYWYGTYQIFRNAGGDGGANGESGVPGRDTYLMLICNPDGFYEERANYRVSGEAGQTLVIENLVGYDRIRIEMTKTTTADRPSQHEPKYLKAHS